MDQICGSCYESHIFMMNPYLRVTFYAFTISLLFSRPLLAQTAELHAADVEACGGYVGRTFPPETRRAHRACVGQRRLARALAERERVAAIHRAPSVYVIAGYDGALLARDAEEGRYRSPSLVVGVEVRRNFLDRFGLYATLGGALGRGVIGGGSVTGSGTTSVNAGVSFTGLVEAGLVIGPFRRLYVKFGPQLRLVVPTRNEATFVFENDGAPDEVHTIRWDAPLLGVGARLAIGVMLGREHATALEVGGGLGGVFGNDAACVTLGGRVAHTFGR